MDWNTFLDTHLTLFNKNKASSSKFMNLSSNYDRVEFLIINEPYLNEINEYLNRIYLNKSKEEEKDIEKSNKLRLQGNEYYKRKDLKQAFKHYTLSLLYAPEDLTSNDKSRILAYSNRSAVFYEEKLYNNCIKDLNETQYILENFISKNSDQVVDEAFLNDIFNLIIKLLSREINCLFYLNDYQKLEEINSRNNSKFFKILKSPVFNILSSKIETNISESIELTKILLIKLSQSEINNSIKLKAENIDNNLSNSNRSHINDCIDIKYEEKKGRYCIANSDIDVGELLFEEAPYSAILLPDFTTSYCEICFRKLVDEDEKFFLYLNIEFCPKCTSVFYCSMTCKKASLLNSDSKKAFHKFECRVLNSLLHYLGIAHLAFRIVNSTDYDLLLKYSTVVKNNVNTFNERDLFKINYKESDNIESDYNQVFNLMTHEKNTHYVDLFKYSLSSILLAKHYLNIFRSKIEVSNDELKVVSCLILRHLLQTICNAHAITQLKDDKNVDSSSMSTFNRDQTRIATAIYSRVSLLNHSCDSNILSSFKENSNKIVVKSSKKIKSFEEIYNCYGPHHLKMNVFARRQSLLEQYKFLCECKACTSQINALNSNDTYNLCGLRCLLCKSIKVLPQFLPNSSDENRRFDEILNLKCCECKNVVKLIDYTKFFDEIDILIDSINYNNRNEDENRKQIKNVQELVKKCKIYLLIDDENEIEDKKIRINEYFKLYYINFSKLIDAMSRLNCNLNQFEIASKQIEKNITLLRFIYQNEHGNSTNNVEVAHELFKLSEVQCRCYQFEKALRNVDEAILIATNFYLNDHEIIIEFKNLKRNILSIINN